MEFYKMSGEQDIEEIIRKAFKAGEEWGVCYSTWFYPSESDTEEKVREAIKNIMDDPNG